MEDSKIMRWIITMISLFSTVVLTAQQWYFSVDERYPAERTHLQDKRRILVVNNALNQPQNFGHSTLIDGETQDNIQVDLSRAILYCLFSTTQTMESFASFDAVELMDISQNPSTNFYSKNYLTYAKAEQLCVDYQADALLTLNQLILYDVLETFPAEGNQYFAYLQTFAQSHWTIHIAGQSQDYSFTQADTLLWESGLHYARANSLNDLPPRQEALLYLAEELGGAVGRSFSPTWHTTRRYIYDTPPLQDGLNAFRLQRWSEAIDIWNRLINEKDKKTAAVAAANIAIAYEMQGDYLSACDYAQRAVRLFSAWKTAYARQQQVNLRYYLERLQERMAREGAL